MGLACIFIIHNDTLARRRERGKGTTDPRVADFNDEVSNLEAVADGSSGGGHMAREPVDDPAAGIEPHICYPFPHLCHHPHPLLA